MASSSSSMSSMSSPPSPPLPGLTSTEAVVRTLKSSHYSYDERLAVAAWLWSNEAVVFPQRQEFVLDWCISNMLRFATKRGASVLGTPAGQLNFWQFLLMAFDSTPTAGLPHQQQQQQQQHRVALPANTPLLPLFVGALRAATEQLDQASTCAEKDVQSMNSVLDIAATCLKRLVTHYGEQFQLTLEHLADAVVLALGVYTLMTDKLLPALLEARYLSTSNGGTSDASVDLVLRRSLFHVDHLADFTTILGSKQQGQKAAAGGSRGNDSRDMTSYQRSLFTRLEAMIADAATSEQVHAVLDMLLRCFIDESRRRQKAAASHNQQGGESSDLPAKQLEFAFFAEMYRINRATVMPPVEALKTGNALLRVLADMHVYQASNERVYEQQRGFFSDIARESVDYLNHAGRCSVDDRRAIDRSIDRSTHTIAREDGGSVGAIRTIHRTRRARLCDGRAGHGCGAGTGIAGKRGHE
ncbi:hypothetical protein SYNPS1DRAFT_30004 [Syncephalis pseudoplumigaleata]|uniref:Uncharacterized protein n=1 Tax=Syncephalis pseudoplumigaleata TaxID=1712513 RepID=A0A4P9YWI9_9FUNG|nr:hypothetical protein SYNPS1DRAFT_30004 [Syncephalis pseudoplumigaleata]|eukprot:RKP24228.1 hypothetical protein SYNPS1DRAFT_30004 [Syncephalis pseudoplumigaleata]